MKTPGRLQPLVEEGLPQAVDAAGNNHAQRMLLRDVGNLNSFFGRFERKRAAVDVGGVLREIDDARAEEAARRLRLQPGR